MVYGIVRPTASSSSIVVLTGPSASKSATCSERILLIFLSRSLRSSLSVSAKTLILIAFGLVVICLGNCGETWRSVEGYDSVVYGKVVSL